MKVSAGNQPITTFPLAFPGQVAWVHSPCYSQELEASVLAMDDFDSNYDLTSAYIASTIQKLSTTEFRNSGGKENDWAARMMKGTAPMNACNMAATIQGAGYPKLVVLTFWNDPCNPVGGGVNYGYLVELKFPHELVDEGGGYIFMGSRGGLDPGRFSKEVVAMNSWMATVLETIERLKNIRPHWPSERKKHMAVIINFFIDRFQKGLDSAVPIKDLEKLLDEQAQKTKDEDAEAKEKASQFVEIEGHKLEKGVLYDLEFSIEGVRHHGNFTVDKLLNQYGVAFNTDKVTNFKNLGPAQNP